METKPAVKEERLVEFVPVGCTDKIKLSVKIVQNLIAVPTRSGRTCSERDALKFIMLCAAKKLNPFESDAFLVGYDGKNGPEFSLITAHQALLKRCELHPEYDGMQSGVIVKHENGENTTDLEGDFHLDEQVLVGAWAKVFFKTRKYPSTDRISLKAFIKTTSDGTPTKFWKENPAGQLVKCFDEQTEVLTTLGFERFDSAAGKILEVGQFGLAPTEARPFSAPHAGMMIRYDSDDVNFCVTPNHDMLTTAGTIEAQSMFDQATFRPGFWIPRLVQNARGDCALDDRAIQLAAAFIADGSSNSSKTFLVSVSRERKVDFLESLGPVSRHLRRCAGTSVQTATRRITTLSDKVQFRFEFADVSELVGRDKVCIPATILAMSRRQAKLFVDTLIFFDGSKQTLTGVRRFYSSRPEVVRAFELASVQAGYSISDRKYRTADISTKPNVCLTISERDGIPVRRCGRRKPTGESLKRYCSLEEVPNESGTVWCVTVPSGLIVVRRAGFSFICGNCAEASAMRKAFPTMCGGMYLREEISLLGEGIGVIPQPNLDVSEPATAQPPTAKTEPAEDDSNPDLAPGGTAKPPAGQTLSDSPQGQLARLAGDNGLTIDAYQRWSLETGNDPEASSRADWSEIPGDICKRLLRAQAGFIRGVKAFAKGDKI